MDPVVLVFLVVVCRPIVVTSSVETPSPCGVNPGGLVAEEGTRSPHGVDSLPCLWLCCPASQALNDRYECSPSSAPVAASPDVAGYHLHVGNPCAHQRYNLEPDEPYRVDDNGTLVVLMEVEGNTTEIDFVSPPGTFCLGVFERGVTSHTLPVVCLTDEEYDEIQGEGFNTWLYSVGMLVSLPFLVATIGVYLLIPELNNLHGKCLVSHVTSLTVGYVILIVIKLLGRDVLSQPLCLAAALMAYFFLLAVFFWLNVMCFDIWWTFSGYRAVVGPRGVSNRNQFWFYSLYGWGAPVVMLGACAVVDFVPGLADYFVKPELGTERCWFEGRLPLMVYFYGPVGVLIVGNLAMFVVTACRILRIRRETAILSVPDNRRSDEDRQNRQRFVLYVKLFVVMGVSWSLEPISWWVGGHVYFWWFSDIINSLKGVFIFLIFVWKPKVRLLVARRFKLGVKGDNSSSRTK